MKLKKIAAAMLAAAMVFGSCAAQGVSAADNASVANDVNRGLSAPENLRYEDGDIKWDGVDFAYGYILNVSDSENEWEKEHNFTDEEDLFVEFDRFCYENSIPLGNYTVKMCAFDASGERSEWTVAVTVEYAATLSTPGNVRLSEDEEGTILWDEVPGAKRYNICCQKKNENEGFSRTHSSSSTEWDFKLYLYESGDFLVSIQAMDENYNVSEWTAPISISYIYSRLDAPQNVRFDESGENILWDEVEGAEYYWVRIYAYPTDESVKNIDVYESVYPREACLTNWKSFTVPFSKANYRIYILACGKGKQSNESECLYASFEMTRDENVAVPDVRLEDGVLRWNNVEGTKYWMTISVNGQYQEIDGSYCYVRYAADHGNNYYIYGTTTFPIGTYDVNLFVVDKQNNYNKKTFSLTFGQSPDESVWVPKMYYKFNDFLWDYDDLRHDNTQHFWVRVKNAKDDTVVKLKRSYYEHLYGFWDLPNGDYTLEICACVYDRNDNQYKVGNWSKPLVISKHGASGFDKENESSEEVIVSPEAADIPDGDKITSITINPAFNMKNKHDNNVELDLSKIKIKAEAIYDEEGLKRAEEALGKTIQGNKQYNLLDLTLLYNGEDFSNGYEGLVQVIIPLPNGHRDKNFSCFRLTEVDGKMVKEVILGEQTEDSYIIYLEHFSLYALVADANPDDGKEETENPEESSPENSDIESSGETDSDTTTSSPENPDLESSGESNSDTTTTSPENSDLEGAGESNSNTTTTSPENSDLEGAGDSNPPTGIALAAAPVILACAAVIAASKKRK